MNGHSEIMLVAAMAANRAIGLGGAMPWHIPADFRRVKSLTMGKPLVMGRKTFESLPGILPGRRHIVITRDTAWHADGAEVVHSFAAALKLANAPQIIIFGGAEIYALALPYATRIELTDIHADVAGDRFMPEFGNNWQEISREDHAAEGGKPAYSFVSLIKGAA
ncbi:MAG: hypothetical protein RLY97_2094 [Pseudomonadota bacterium]|jgi:dihydrofolate reductase